MSGSGGPRRTAAAPPASTARQPSTRAAPTTTVAPTTTRRPTTTAPPTTKKATGSTLGAAGYDVVAANTALGSFSSSRVYYTPGHRADAEAFRDRFPAFSRVEPAPANLSDRVALHVVIGKDYPGV